MQKDVSSPSPSLKFPFFSCELWLCFIGWPTDWLVWLANNCFPINALASAGKDIGHITFYEHPSSLPVTDLDPMNWTNHILRNADRRAVCKQRPANTLLAPVTHTERTRTCCFQSTHLSLA